MLKSFLISILQKLFPPPHLLMDRIVDVLKLFGELGTLEINDAMGVVFGKKPGLGNIYVALHHLEIEGKVTNRWSEETYPERGGVCRKYYRLAEIAPWELVKLDQN